MNRITLNHLKKLAFEKGLKTEQTPHGYIIKSDTKELYTVDGLYKSDTLRTIHTIINNLIEEKKGWTLRRFTHIWRSSEIESDPEGFLEGQINGEWVAYNYAKDSFDDRQPSGYSSMPDLKYLGYLDLNSPINLENRNYEL